MAKPERLEAIRDKLKAGKRLTAAEQREVDQASEESRYLPSLEAVALRFGATRKALDKWKPYDTENALERTEHGYDLDAIKRLRTRMHAEGKNPRLLAGDDTGGGELDPQALKARKLWLECEKMSTQIQILLGKYALVDTVMEHLMPIIYAFNERLMRIPAETAYQLSGMKPSDIEDRLREVMEKALAYLADEEIPRLHAAISKPTEEMPETTRLPAARELNGAQKA